MSNLLRQTAAVVGWDFRSLGGRYRSSLAAVAGFFAVVLVFAAVLAIHQGFANVMTDSASPYVAYVAGTSSNLDNDTLDVIGHAPGVVEGPHGPLVAGGVQVTAEVPLRSSGQLAGVNMRGLPADIAGVWPDFHIVKGRMFKPGLDEIIVGRKAVRLFRGLAIGDTFDWNGVHWKVVGIFAKGGGSRESEIWADVHQLQAAFHASNSYSVAYVRLTSPGAYPHFKKWLETNPQLNVRTFREVAVWQRDANSVDKPLALIGGVIILLMAIGAVFGALNIMYATVATRARDIATLRALGFARLPVVVAVVLEGIVLGLIGGIIAAVIAYLVFNGYEASTATNGAMMAFSFAVTPTLIMFALVLAIVMGLIGGLFPAIRAAHLPVAAALREA